MQYATWKCPEGCDGICGCGLDVGQVKIRSGSLCHVDEDGRLHLRAPRAADVQMARRVAAALRAHVTAGGQELLPSDITSVKEGN